MCRIRILLAVSLVSVFVLAGASQVQAISVAYITGTTEPWSQQGNVNALNAVFGSGGWTRYDWSNAGGVLAPGAYQMIFADGGDAQTLPFEAFVNTNRTALEAWVAGGGSLILEAARWDDSSPFNLGFGGTLNYSASSTASAPNPAHPVINGPFGNTGTSFWGSYFSHDYITGAGFTTILTGNGNATLVEKDWGSGHVILSGLTLPFSQHPSWSPNTWTLHQNLLDYAADEVAVIPEPVTMAGLTFALMGLGAYARRRRTA